MIMPTIEQVRGYAAKLATQAMPDYPHDEMSLHCYRNQDGIPMYWRVRVKTHAAIPSEKRRKEIRPFWHNGQHFVVGEPANPPEGKPIYALELLATYPVAKVIVCEGENKADVINKLSMQGGTAAEIVATTSGGASSAAAANWQPLAGREVVLWPDNDDAGLKYATEVVEHLLGISNSVSILEIASMALPHKGDAVDYFKAGKSIGQLLQKIESAKQVSRRVIPAHYPLEIDSGLSNYLDDSITPPEPLPNLPDVQSFDYAYLPDGLRGFVKDISDRMQCPPDFAAVGVFVMMATIIGRKVGMRPKRKDDGQVQIVL